MFQIPLTFPLLRFGLDKSMRRYPTPSRRLQQPMKVSSPSSHLLSALPLLVQTNLQVQTQDGEVDNGDHAAFLDPSPRITISKRGLSLDLALHEAAGSAAFMLRRIQGVFPNVENTANDIQTRHLGISFSFLYWQSYRKYKQTQKERNKLAQGKFTKGVI